MIFSIVFFILSFFSFGIASSTCPKDFEEANRSYEAGQFEHAADLYQRCISSGFDNADLYYNLGNTWYRLGKPGLAILNYAKAAHKYPADPDISANLQFASSRIKDNPKKESSPIVDFLWKIHTFFGLEEGILLLLLGWFFIAILVSWRFFSKGSIRAVLSTFILILSVLTFAGFVSNGFKLYQNYHSSEGVILSPISEVLSGPGEHFKLLFRLHEGTRFQVIGDKQQDWISIGVGSSIRGYIRKSDAGFIQ